MAAITAVARINAKQLQRLRNTDRGVGNGVVGVGGHVELDASDPDINGTDPR